jgi:hypothetical protein
MKKIQIQLPDPLYRDLKILSKHLDYSIAELLRKGAEQIAIYYPQILKEESENKDNKLPEPKKMGLKISDPEKLRSLANQR